ncbi:MAG TPA: NAD(P)-dependent oxidoreductase [Nitrososphaerales archaeon]|nr:NAD(P)-dependent oxidoreductase [Nitrososphaerales archaeon]
MIFSTARLHEPARELLSGFGLVEHDADDATLAKCDVLFTLPHRVTPDLMRRMPNLRAIQSYSAGVDGLDYAAVPKNVRIYSNSGGFTRPVAEQAWSLVLSLAKGANVRRKRVLPRLLRGKTLVVLGCGAIGSEVARIGREAFSMKTVGVSVTFTVPEAFDERRDPGSLAGAVAKADVIVDALPLNKDTVSILDYKVLKRMKAEAILVNVGRGETVDREGVTRLLRERPETRFGTDVFWRTGGKEDFETPLWDMENFAGTFHSAVFGRDDALAEAEVMAAENIRRFLTIGDAMNRVDRGEYAGVGLYETTSSPTHSLNNPRGERGVLGHSHAQKEVRHRRTRRADE